MRQQQESLMQLHRLQSGLLTGEKERSINYMVVQAILEYLDREEVC